MYPIITKPKNQIKILTTHQCGINVPICTKCTNFPISKSGLDLELFWMMLESYVNFPLCDLPCKQKHLRFGSDQSFNNEIMVERLLEVLILYSKRMIEVHCLDLLVILTVNLTLLSLWCYQAFYQNSSDNWGVTSDSLVSRNGQCSVYLSTSSW